ncbi:MAG: ABC transporter substrate-binding protein/permease [Gemmataceae bacterium]|nr:ABC transporter substrate-binding protein/permease [Gemmataceae bacterium]
MNQICRWILLGSFLLLAGCGRPQGDALAAVLARGELRWGGDEEGGGPYIYRADDNAQIVTGFEFDLMSQLASGLGVRSRFESSNWPELLKTLHTGTVDVVVNGYELTPERLRDQIASIPYYAYELHLFARNDDSTISDWNSLKGPRTRGGSWRVGVLKNTAADSYMTRAFAGTVEVRRYEGTTDAFRDVENGALDATVTDTPPAVYYGKRFKVKQAGPAVERGWYVMYFRPTDIALRDRINDGLRKSFRNGSYRAILDKYGIWTEAQNELIRPETEILTETMRPGESAVDPWEIVRNNLPLLIKAAGMTLLLSVLAMPFAIMLGLTIALGRQFGPWFVRGPLAMYVEVVRGTPVLLQLYFIHFGLVPLLGLPDGVRAFAPIVSAVCGLALNYAAYESEIYRAGLAAIPVGQTEAALALGLTRRQALRYVIVPQAVRMVIPPVTNDFICLFKDTSICSVIAVEELSKRYNIASNDAPRAFAQLALVTALLYLMMSYPLSLLARRLENRPGRSVR